MHGLPQGRGGERRARAVEKDPGRRLAVGQGGRLGFRDSRPGEAPRRAALQGAQREARAVDDGDRHERGDPVPAAPAVKAEQIVGDEQANAFLARPYREGYEIEM